MIKSRKKYLLASLALVAIAITVLVTINHEHNSHQDELPQLLDDYTLDIMYQGAHYDSAHSTGSKGLLTLIGIIEGDSRYSSFKAKKILAGCYYSLGLHDDIDEEARKEYLEKSKVLYQTLWDSYPYDERVARHLVYLTENKEERFKFAKKLVEIDPDNVFHLRGLSISYKGRGEIDKAIEYARKAYDGERPGPYKRTIARELMMLYTEAGYDKKFEEFQTEFDQMLEKERQRLKGG